MTGLCGDADGDKFNDFVTANDKEVTEGELGYAEIGDSHQVIDTDDTRLLYYNYNDTSQGSCHKKY